MGGPMGNNPQQRRIPPPPQSLYPRNNPNVIGPRVHRDVTNGSPGITHALSSNLQTRQREAQRQYAMRLQAQAQQQSRSNTPIMQNKRQRSTAKIDMEEGKALCKNMRYTLSEDCTKSSTQLKSRFIALEGGTRSHLLTPLHLRSVAHKRPIILNDESRHKHTEPRAGLFSDFTNGLHNEGLVSQPLHRAPPSISARGETYGLNTSMSRPVAPTSSHILQNDLPPSGKLDEDVSLRTCLLGSC